MSATHENHDDVVRMQEQPAAIVSTMPSATNGNAPTSPSVAKKGELPVAADGAPLPAAAAAATSTASSAELDAGMSGLDAAFSSLAVGPASASAAGAAAAAPHMPPSFPPGTESDTSLRVPNDQVGRVIGRGGQSIREVQDRSGAFVHMPKESLAGQDFRIVQITGTAQQIAHCKVLLQLRMTSREDAPRVASLQAELAKFQRPPTVVKVNIPPEHVGRVIGRGGQTIRQLQDTSGALVDLPRDPPPGEMHRVVTITGDPQQVAYCHMLLMHKITPREEGGLAGPGPSPPPYDPNCVIVQIPDEHVGRVIGKHGAHIREMQEISGAKVYLPKECVPGYPHREMTISGSEAQISKCQQMLLERMTPPGQQPQPLVFIPHAASWTYTSDAYGASWYPQGFGGATDYSPQMPGSFPPHGFSAIPQPDMFQYPLPSFPIYAPEPAYPPPPLVAPVMYSPVMSRYQFPRAGSGGRGAGGESLMFIPQ